MLRFWDKWILFSFFGLFIIGESILVSIHVIPYLIDSYDKLSIYRKPLLQLMVFFFGFLFASLIARVDYRLFLRNSLPYLVVYISMFSLLLVVIKKNITGKNVDRWLFGGSVQPLEFAKISLILFLSYYIVRKGNLRQWKHLFWALFLPLLMAFLLILQPDKGGAMFLLILAGIIAYVGGVPKKAYLLIAIPILIFVLFILTSKGYVAERLSAWQDPFSDPEDSGYQIIQSIYALARGGLLGVGLGQGIQKLGPLPASDTDYIISILGEEMGFLGIGAVILLYSILIGRLINHSLRATDPFEKLLLFGVAVNFALSFVWNMAMVSNLIPPKGIALPFLSYGSSNLFASLLMLGLAQSVINFAESRVSNPTRTSSTPILLRHA